METVEHSLLDHYDRLMFIVSCYAKMLLTRTVLLIVCNIALYEEVYSRRLPPIVRRALNVLWYDKPAHAVKRMVTLVENEGMKVKSYVSHKVDEYVVTRKLAQKRLRNWWKNLQTSIQETRDTMYYKLQETKDLYWDPPMEE